MELDLLYLSDRAKPSRRGASASGSERRTLPGSGPLAEDAGSATTARLCKSTENRQLAKQLRLYRGRGR